MKSAFTLLSPGGRWGRLSVVIFHRVLPEPDPIFPGEVDASRFDAVCGWLAQWFNVLPLDEAVQRLRDGCLPVRAAAITFDDGYADNHDVALPILRRHGLSATFFIASGYLDGGCMWNDAVIDAFRQTTLGEVDLREIDALSDLERLPLHGVAQRRAAIQAVIRRIKYLPVDQRDVRVETLRSLLGTPRPVSPMMGSDDVRAIRRAGMVIGAHTVSHPILARLDVEAARAEISTGRKVLEELLQERVGLFAYPNGKPGEDYVDDTVALTRQLGFDAAFTTAWGAARPETDLFQIPRFSPWDESRLRYGLRMANNLWSSRRGTSTVNA